MKSNSCKIVLEKQLPLSSLYLVCDKKTPMSPFSLAMIKITFPSEGHKQNSLRS